MLNQLRIWLFWDLKQLLNIPLQFFNVYLTELQYFTPGIRSNPSSHWPANP